MSLSSRECGCQALGSGHRSSTERLLHTDSTTYSSLCSPPLRCPVCVDAILKLRLERYQQAVDERNATREHSDRELERLSQGQSTLSEIQFESQQLLDRLGSLQKECSTLAVRVTAQAVENEDRQARQQQAWNIREKQQQLDRLRESLCEGALQEAIITATERVRYLRFQWAMRAFVIHGLHVDPDNDAIHNNKTTGNSSNHHHPQTTQHPALRRLQHARGIGKIGGLPLPHAGPELYGVLPPRELQSALRLVASLTCTVARCLAIVLPHPILLKPSDGTTTIGDIIDTVAMKQQQQQSLLPSDEKRAPPTPNNNNNNHNTNKTNPVGSSSTSSLMSLMEITTTSIWGRSTKNANARAASGQTSSDPVMLDNPSSFMPSTSSSSSVSFINDTPAVVAQRVLHTSCAVLAEDSKSTLASRYALSQAVMHQEEFAIALQLLQNDVIALCIRAGVPVNHLFPAEALLLNLHALASYCQEQVNANY